MGYLHLDLPVITTAFQWCKDTINTMYVQYLHDVHYLLTYLRYRDQENGGIKKGCDVPLSNGYSS
jgi:hypothetical protein